MKLGIHDKDSSPVHQSPETLQLSEANINTIQILVRVNKLEGLFPTQTSAETKSELGSSAI